MEIGKVTPSRQVFADVVLGQHPPLVEHSSVAALHTVAAVKGVQCLVALKMF